MKSDRPSSLVVVVVAYGSADLLRRCLMGLGGAYRSLVIDNSGCQSCADIAARAGAEYVNPGRNLGFAAAVNRALAIVEPAQPDVLLLNPDAVIDAAAVSALHDRLHAPGNERVAAVAPVQWGSNHERQRVNWPFPSPAADWAAALGAVDRFKRWQFLAGSVLLLRSSAIDEIGPFDERFFLYGEEADWQWRAHLQGWEVLLCRDVEAFHGGGGASSDQVVKEALFHASHELLIRKWYGSMGWRVSQLATLVGALGRAATRSGAERRAALLRARLQLTGPVRAARRLGLL